MEFSGVVFNECQYRKTEVGHVQVCFIKASELLGTQ